MGMDFVEQFPELINVLTDFDKKNNTNLTKIIKEGPEEELRQTKYTQPAILFHSIISLQALQKYISIEPDFVAGHSLGEITALVANGVLSFADALYLVHKRGEFMIKANQGTPYAMAAIIGLEPSIINEICTEASSEGLVVVANYNSPEQTVISGTENGVKRACELATQKGAKRALPLPVGGPFHSPLIAQASEWLAQEMDKLTFNETDIPVISNVDAKAHTSPQQIKENLTRQVTSSVLWVDCVNELISLGTDLFLEFGPKKVLAGMIKKIDRNVEIISLDTIQDLRNVRDALEQY
ncbi:MAG: ACP S-malonyltransferase [Candidatus Cloacimonetes bacterium]|nr:ACP S-malonyltransferase [Candidatus Cloacimonadota bacterium]